MLHNPPGERNKQPILEKLQKYIDSNVDSRMLEISSGPGLHASYIAGFFPKLLIQTSEFDTGMFKSIKAYRENCGATNILEPVFIDSSQDLDSWEAKYQGRSFIDCQNSFDYLLNINMIHVSPIECTEGLFASASKLLKPGGLLFTYGAYSVNGIIEPESNVSFNESLKQRNSTWGIRDIADIQKIASANSIELIAKHDLPANNKFLVWKKT